jgi:hypothetical protein
VAWNDWPEGPDVHCPLHEQLIRLRYGSDSTLPSRRSAAALTRYKARVISKSLEEANTNSLAGLDEGELSNSMLLWEPSRRGPCSTVQYQSVSSTQNRCVATSKSSSRERVSSYLRTTHLVSVLSLPRETWTVTTILFRIPDRRLSTRCYLSCFYLLSSLKLSNSPFWFVGSTPSREFRTWVLKAITSTV